MITWLARLHPFRTRESRRLAVLFAVVYFAQGMWDLPTQTLTLTLKEAGLSAGQVADFTLMGTVPWLLKPLYGLLSDLVPLFGRRRTSYVIVMSGLASAAGLAVATAGHHTYWRLALGVAAMGLGLAFADVMIDALMVERGRALGVTGAFQSVQWASIYAAVVLVGLVGGHLAERRDLHTAFALAAAFPLVTCALTAAFVREARAPADRQAVRRTAAAIREAARDRELWIVAGFVFFVTFSPSFGPAFLYYQTDVLHFSQRFIGGLGAVSGVGYVLGAVVYAPLSRRVPLARLVAWTIGLTAAANLAYLLYRTPAAAVAIDLAYGVAAMLAQLALLEVAAKACPPRLEATVFALLMGVYNGGMQLATNVGGRLYDWLGYEPLVLISTAFTAAAWGLLPFVRIGRIEARARAAARASAGGG